jgi:hypothetical protein
MIGHISAEEISGKQPHFCEHAGATNRSNYWRHTEAGKGFYLEELTQTAVKTLTPVATSIREAAKTYNGKVHFQITADFIALCSPSLGFDRQFINLVEYLDAEIDIQLNVSTCPDCPHDTCHDCPHGRVAYG